MLAVRTDPRPINDAAFAAVLAVPPAMSCAEFADAHFFLPSEASNTSGPWTTTKVQLAILNAFGNDAIERVAFQKPARFGATKMQVAANAYFTAHKRRNVGYWQPTQSDSDGFVKTELNPSIRDCKPWRDALIDKREESPKNTLSIKQFLGSTSHYRGGSSANNFRRLTLDCVLIDELDGFSSDIGNEGDAVTLSYGRIKNAVHPKQILISTPTIKNSSLIEKACLAAEDILEFHVKCPECGEHGPVQWGGKDKDYGFIWKDRDASSVMHHGQCCGVGWGNDKLTEAVEDGYWIGGKGWQTTDGLEWTKDGEPSNPPRSIAFRTWQALSPFSSWRGIVEEFHDALGDSKKLQAWRNTTLAETWDEAGEMSVTPELFGSILPTTDPEQLAQIKAVTCGLDTQNDRLECSYYGHATDKSIYLLGHSVVQGRTDEFDVYREMTDEILAYRFNNGEHDLGVMVAAIDTQGGNTDTVHQFLQLVKRAQRGYQFIGINGHGRMWSRIADKPSQSETKGTGKKEFYSIGVNTLKSDVYELIGRFDQPERAYRVVQDAPFPPDFAEQITAEKQVRKTVEGKLRTVFINEKQKRNEALDCCGYALAAKAWAQKFGSRQMKNLFNQL